MTNFYVQILLFGLVILIYIMIYLARSYVLIKSVALIKDWIKSIFNTLNEAVFYFDKNGKLVIANEYAKALIDMENESKNKDKFRTLTIESFFTGEEIDIVDYVIMKSKMSFKGYTKSTGEDIGRNIVQGTIVPIFFTKSLYVGSIAILRNITLEIKSKEIIYNMTNYDNITGVPNKNYFMDYLNLSIQNAKLDNKMLALIIIDLDNFKTVNDIMGYSSGDILLKSVANTVKLLLSRGSQLSRIGGDEFTLVIPSISRIEEIMIVARKLGSVFSKPWEIDDREYYLTASIGISVYPHDGVSQESLIINAETALQNAKQAGKNNYKFYTRTMNTSIVERFDVENNLRQAIEKNELKMYYQPIISAKDLRFSSVEALVRWEHPLNGIILPNNFIPIAEDSGLINGIGEIALRGACEQHAIWSKLGLKNLSIAVNISVKQFRHNNLLNVFEKIIRETKIDPKFLELEITESCAMNDIDYMIHLFNEFKKMGMRISVDDFGTGYSSINYLKLLPIDTLKIDRSFICDIEKNSAQREIIRALIALAHGIDLKVTAEGVETIEQLEFLRLHKCDNIQGFLFSKALPPEKIVEFYNVDLNKKILEIYPDWKP